YTVKACATASARSSGQVATSSVISRGAAPSGGGESARRAAMTACRSRSTSSSRPWPPDSRSTSPSRPPSRRTSRRIGAATCPRRQRSHATGQAAFRCGQARSVLLRFRHERGDGHAGREEQVRFAIKTRPEHQTWAQIRDVWLAADEISLFESGWNWDHFYPL